MASTFASGIACVAPIMVLALFAHAPAESTELTSGRSATLDIVVSGARSHQGVIRLALCPDHSGFPECAERALRSASLLIDNGVASVHLTGIPAGTYAVGVFHDTNGNGKLDTFLGIPREGFGFSRNPPLRPRAPRFDEAAMPVVEQAKAQIALRYIL